MFIKKNFDEGNRSRCEVIDFLLTDFNYLKGRRVAIEKKLLLELHQSDNEVDSTCESSSVRSP